MTVAGLLLHLHERVGPQGSSGTLYQGTAAASSPPDPPETPAGLWISEQVVIAVDVLWFQGEFEAGKYRCLICSKEFNSESGVKYHINSVHAEVPHLPLRSSFCSPQRLFVFPTSSGLVCDQQKSLQEV